MNSRTERPLGPNEGTRLESSKSSMVVNLPQMGAAAACVWAGVPGWMKMRRQQCSLPSVTIRLMSLLLQLEPLLQTHPLHSDGPHPQTVSPDDTTFLKFLLSGCCFFVFVFITATRKATNTDNWYHGVELLCDKPHWVTQKPWGLLWGGGRNLGD